MEAKRLLRQSLLAQRRAMSLTEVGDFSARITSRLLESVAAHQRVFCYASQGNEVQTHDLIVQWLKRSVAVALPRIMPDGSMQAVPITSWDELSAGPHGILQPPVATQVWDTADWCVLPCAAVTAKGHRLGRGGGHYDRWLSGHRSSRSVALAYAWQVVDALPIEPWDQTVDQVITETRTIGPIPTR